MKGAILVLALIVAVALAADTSKYLKGIIRDQSPSAMKDLGSCGTANNGNGFSGTDFQLNTDDYKNYERGLVGPECNATSRFKNCGVLGADGTPSYIFPGKSPWGNIQSPDTFYTWFHNSPKTKNVNYTIQLTKNKNAATYSFDDQTFFPIDGKGWNDYAWVYCDDNGRNCAKHNFAFCLEAHTRFGYASKDMVFTFSGDDDVWVYIDNKLVIDLGALHPSETKSVTLGDLPFLTLGNNYILDFFYCERHTAYSHMQITTSIEFFCLVTDWCGVCEGNGQSCCHAAELALCDDKDACTIDSCGITQAPPAGCTHTPVTNCTTTNKCKSAKCDKTKGCQITDIVCNDNNACTTDTCNPSSGCVYTPKACNDDNKCTTDSCGADGECQFTPKNCDDGDECTSDSCSPTTGACVHSNKTCNDGSKCTKDYCDPTYPGGCRATSICDDSNPCTTDKCVSASQGCSNTPKDCSTSNKCLIGSCDASNGGNCKFDAVQCPPKDACNLPVCNNATGCQYQPPNCDDNDPCTIDTCDKVKGCQHSDVSCNDNNRCTTDACVSAKGGCIFTPINLDDNNKCTADACTPTGGVTHTNITASCNDNDACTVDGCSPTAGCTYTKLSCDDNDPCTKDTCDKVGGCKHDPIVGCVGCPNGFNCIAVDKCHTSACDGEHPGQCINTTITCDDGNACSIDKCNLADGSCSNTPKNCSSPPDACHLIAGTCDAAAAGACKYPVKTCDDNDPCTADSCGLPSGLCSNTLISAFCSPCGASACNYTDPCNPVVCNAVTLKCEPAPVKCDDGNACTEDVCVKVGDGSAAKAQCKFTTKPCANSGDVCSPNVCDTTTGCAPKPVVCKDTDACTEDKCANVNGTATCQFTPKTCTTIDPCKPLVCNAAGDCVEDPVVCKDNSPCTQDLCITQEGKATCIFPPVLCESDNCGTKVCNETSGSCETAIKTFVCNDGNPCTDDVPSCNGTAVTCNFTTNNICDDHNECTIETCDSANTTAPCQRSNVTCYPPDICQVVKGCDPKAGCLFGPIDCDATHDVCKKAKCDPRAGGCIVEPKVCTVSDTGCFKATCDSSRNGTDQDPCVTEKLDNWGSRESNNHILCALRYDDTVKHAAIGAGAAAGIAIGAAAAFGAIGYGGKKGYDYWKSMQDQRFNGVQNNPLYEAQSGSNDNPLYRNSMTN